MAKAKIKKDHRDKPLVCNLLDDPATKDKANSHPGYMVHRRRGEEPCVGCTTASSAYKNTRSRRSQAIATLAAKVLKKRDPAMYDAVVRAVDSGQSDL